MKYKLPRLFFLVSCTLFLLASLSLLIYLLLASFHIFSCSICSTKGWVIPAIGIAYFIGLLIGFFTQQKRICIFSPYGLLGSGILALCMQLSLLSMCVPCYLVHVFHVTFWGLCFYQRYRMPVLSGAVLACAIALPLFHFTFPPMKINLNRFLREGMPQGYVLNIVQPGCQFCLYEIPFFNAFAQRMAKQGILCILVSTSDDLATNEPFQRKAPDVQIIHYDNALIHPQCVIDGYPFFIFADGQGRVVSSSLGLPDDIDRFLEERASLLFQK